MVDTLRSVCEGALAEILDLGESERRYLARFYEEGLFEPVSMFEGLGVNSRLKEHPMAAWRLAQRSR